MTSPVPRTGIQPLVSWPRHVVPGGSYLITVDLQLTDPSLPWPYDEEEFAIGCMLDGRPACNVHAVGDTAVVLHRFGGTYGPARFMAEIPPDRTDLANTALWLTLTTAGGVPFYIVKLPLDGTPLRIGELPLDDTPQPPDPEWYKRAVFYEVLVRGFQDASGDGTGDIRGLTSRLDYLQWLGIDCIWLSPIYDSPLRDGGYDIADYLQILPEYGNIADFVELVDQAHLRGIRIVLDIVLNHTSDAHPWFQASRSDPNGPYGDFYVWSDNPEQYADARIIYVDTETSNWTFDPVRGQYFWHRFFSHQPDLNFENPRVQYVMIEMLKFWLDLGIDGYCLKSCAFLYEREGTNCENLNETHEYLRRIRAEIDRSYPDRVLLAEANQWPADVVEYFGDPDTGGNECHMAFHFPLAPRIFMAVRREQRYPVSEIMAQTPRIPAGCQWGIFLRNHDELTLEMVTDEERDYMYAEYAKDARMKANIGIRRRLAPLLDNDRNQLELFTALLLSLPGSPVMYYGDEIGMGDNIWLGDRDGVRTPMQWTPDRNGGFSHCDPQRLYLPPIMDPIYGFQSLNVETQERTPQSLLHWTKRMIEIRKRHPVFGLGAYEELNTSNPSVLAFVREYDAADSQAEHDPADRILCVNNLSRSPQPVELDLRRFSGVTPVECMAGVAFPPIGELPYLLTLPSHGFYWFQLPVAREEDREPPPARRRLPFLK